MIVISNMRRGFTLIELLCTMAISSILLLLAATMLRSSGDGYERVGGSVASEREARALITQLTSDLSTALYHEDEVIEKSSAAWPQDRIGILSLQPAQAQTDVGRVGDLCAVNYYIKDLTISGKTVRCIMRGFRESSETFKALQDDKVVTLFSARDTIDEPVAFGILSFEARPKSRDASGQWVDWDRADSKGPEALDVRVIIARRDLAARFKQAADWDGSGLLGNPGEEDRNKNLEVYSTLITFGNHANH
jgi:prepilin-type N-terminal cleavage/methylation domain-containing protein